MDDTRHCPQCGKPLDAGACPRCGGGTDDDVIEVDATPIGTGRGLELRPDAGEETVRPRVEVRRFVVRQQGGGGCCLAGCLGVGFLLFLLFRGFASLF